MIFLLYQFVFMNVNSLKSLNTYNIVLFLEVKVQNCD